MKGVIAIALRELVSSKLGPDKWPEVLARAGIDKDKEPVLLPTADIDDEKVLAMIRAVCGLAGLTLAEAADLFGEHWVRVYSQRLYPVYYKNCRNAREFLLKLDAVHAQTTATIANAHPPRFRYRWADDKTLVMTYASRRKLIDLAVGLIRGVGRHYGEELQVKALSATEIEVKFP